MPDAMITSLNAGLLQRLKEEHAFTSAQSVIMHNTERSAVAAFWQHQAQLYFDAMSEIEKLNGIVDQMRLVLAARVVATAEGVLIEKPKLDA